MSLSADLSAKNYLFCLPESQFLLLSLSKNIFARYESLNLQLCSFSTLNIAIHFFLACIIFVAKLALTLLNILLKAVSIFL